MNRLPKLAAAVFALLLIALAPTAVPLWASAPAAPSAVTLTSTFAATPPSIDGVLGFGEWNTANKLTFTNGFVTVVNDNLRLYMLIDVTGDNTSDANDYFWLTFDVNRDAAITPNVDKNYGLVPGSGNLRYQFYLGPNQWTGLQANTYSSRGAGFGCFWGDGTLSIISIFPLRFNCARHRVWELAIDLAEIGSTAGGSARMGLRVSSGTPNFTVDTPANFTSNFSNLIDVALASGPLIPAPLAGAAVTFETDPIEVTQAVQRRDNTLPLVANKSTVARVYTRTANVGSAQLAKTYLYGSQGGVDLPGSPLAKLQSAPTTINRNNLNDTATFALPKSWTSGTTNFSAKAVNFLNNTASTSAFNLSFTAKAVPTYWVVPINTGTNSAPVVPSNAEIASQESYLKAVYPLSDVNFVQKSWTVIGPTTVANTISALNSYYNSTVLAWALTVIFTGKQPFDLPSQIYGLTPSGGGISDPVWLGGAGRVARGFRGTSLEGTMAHEINHNLDRSSNGTWGRHVPNGCGASGPDPNWPYANSNVNEVGFDTRTPWSTGPGTLTVIPNTDPDLMSYCQSGHLPTKWISPYRWSNLFNTFAAASLQPAQIAAVTTVYYLSGHINRNGTGQLDPVLVQPGVPTANPDQGEYSIQLIDKNSTTQTAVTFPVEFLDDPDETVNTVYFNFQVPVSQLGAVRTVGQIVLRRGREVLDQITVSSNAPSVSITAPTGGTLTGVQNVQWNASDPDGDPLSFTVLYSPDNGTTWTPVANNLTGNSLAVDTSTLPGGSSAKFRVIASDGFNNAQADSATFTIPNNTPTALILAPAPGAVVPIGEAVTLEGDANDPEDGPLPDDALVWKEGDTVIGSGRSASAVLPPGLHTITLLAQDANGASTQSSVQVLVGTRVFLPLVVR